MKNVVLCVLSLITSIALAGYEAAYAQTPTYTVGGNSFGLSSGKSVTLLLNGATTLTLTTNGAFTFPTALATGASYTVTIAIQPAGQSCVVANGTGTNISDDVVNVGISCSSTYTIGGSVSGLNASGLVLRMNSTNLIIANGATSFKFATALSAGSFYFVSIGIQPIGQTCLVSGGSGVVGNANPVGISVTCTNSYTVGGSIAGLATSGLVLKLNGGASKIIPSSATSFAFSTGLTTGASYLVSIGSQPASQLCLVSNPSGTIATSNINNIVVTCNPVPLIWDTAGQWNYSTWN